MSAGQEECPAGPARPERPRGSVGAMVAAAGLLLLKLKPALGLLKLLGTGKFWLSMLSMGAMVWFEAQRYGLAFGVGFVLLLLIHELGHGWAIRRHGLAAGWPVFIPFVGAMISLKGQPRDADVEAEVAYAGPVAGTAASLACAALGLGLGGRLLLALAHTGFFLNLFNLVPVSPLDGGRVARAFSRRAWIIGALLLGALFLASRTPQLLIIALLAFMQLRRADAEPLPPALQRTWARRYFGLCFFLGAALFFTQRLLGPA